jgi:transglutaminase-like putative cysteine protease
MRIKVAHETLFAYSPPAKSVIQLLRLTPRSYEGQHVLRWRISTDVDCVLRQSEDSLGNVLHTLSYGRPVEQIGVIAEGEIETFDAAGIVRGAVDPLPPDIYLRTSPRAEANGALREFAEEAARGADAPLDKLHALMSAVHETMTYESDPPRGPMIAAESFAMRRGTAQDFAHIFIACARWLGAPARYASGFLMRADEEAQETSHAWAEAYAPVIGWVGFDCANSICVDENYVRIAIGFDNLSAAPTRGSRSGGGEETVKTALKISQAQSQRQS